MKKITPKIKLILSFCLCLFLLGACSDEPKDAADAGQESTVPESAEADAADEPGDVVARVGDQTITFGEINTMMNSSPIVGLDMPALGTPGRDKVRLTLLDKMISANLIYLDALKQGVDKDPDYQRDLRDFSDGILAGLYRQKEIMAMRDETQEDERENRAKEWDLNYISLDGDIGCMVNGAGLAMATMDLIKLCGGEPANFLDVGGGATRERVSEAFKIILSDSNVKGILVNIFGGIVRCDLIAEGIIGAVEEVHVNVPVVVRLEGNNAERGSQLLSESDVNIIAANDLTDAATKIVAAVNENDF
jgi:hypothetical protein